MSLRHWSTTSLRRVKARRLNGIVTNPIYQQLYRNLPAGFYAEPTPTPFPAPTLIELNVALLAHYGLEPSWFQSAEAAALLTGQTHSPDNPPLALAYAGHQFGNFVPLLGDGRALLLGQMAAHDGRAIDVQLKGSGRTAYSRGGDGRATLGSVLREYLVSEAMAGLGIATTRSLAVLTTGETVRREQRQPGAVLVRTATSHMRVGSFQYAATHLGPEAVQALADHVIARNFADLSSAEERYAKLLDAVNTRQAELIARWMLVGFIHGVMNTDNMSIVGETIDFGPCAFVDEFNPGKVFSSIDRRGRYAWNQQPAIAHWNLTRFAETLLPLLDSEQDRAIELAKQQLTRFAPQFSTAFYAGLAAKLGLAARSEAGDTFADTTLQLLAAHDIDYTVFFDALTIAANLKEDVALLELCAVSEDGQREASEWLQQWRTLRAMSPLDTASMRRANPRLIARNHLVEKAIAAAERNADYTPFRRLARALASPFDVATTDDELLSPPRIEERVTATFCGT